MGGFGDRSPENFKTIKRYRRTLVTVKPVKLDTLKSRTPLELGRLLCRERSDSHTCVQTLKSWTLDYVGHLVLEPQGVQLNRFHCILNQLGTSAEFLL